MKKVATVDLEHYKKIRANVTNFLKQSSKKYDSKDAIVLDIAPQIHEGAKAHFRKAVVQTLDIDKKSSATYIADICVNNSKIIPDNYFDIIVCTEVLEHVQNPFSAILEIKRILKPEGCLLISVPFNFRIHGPLPDCWRFTEHGLRFLLEGFDIKIMALETKGRFLMPIHYTIEARVKKI